jgi:hypothetical protein
MILNRKFISREHHSKKFTIDLSYSELRNKKGVIIFVMDLKVLKTGLLANGRRLFRR